MLTFVRVNKFLLGAFLFFCIFVSVMSFAHSIQKPFTLDEADLANRASSITEMGPRTFIDGHQLTHPPLYQYTIAFIYKLFGYGELAGRGFGVLCYVLSGIFLSLILQRLLVDESRIIKQTALYLFAALYLINPNIIQNSMYVDADTTWMVLFTTAFVYVFIRFEDSRPDLYLKTRFMLMGIILFAFLSKEITPVLTMLGLSSYRILNRQWRRWALEIGLIFVLGLGLAWLIWWIYCVRTGTDIMSFLEYTLLRKTPRALNPKILLGVIRRWESYSRWPLYWSSAPLMLLLLSLVGWRGYEFCKKKRLEFIDFVSLIGLSVWVPYHIIKPSIDSMKYQQSGRSVLLAAIVFMVVMCFRKTPERISELIKRNPLILGGTVILMIGLGLHYYRIGDYILFLWDSADNARWTSFIKSYYTPIWGVAGSVLGVGIVRRMNITQALVTALVTLVIPIHVALDFKQMAPYTTATSWLNYGEQGFDDLIDHLSSRVRNDMKIAGRDDIIAQLHRRHGIRPKEVYHVPYIFDARNDVHFAILTQDPELKFIILDQISHVRMTPAYEEEVVQFLSRDYYIERNFGRFIVLRRKPVMRTT